MRLKYFFIVILAFSIFLIMGCSNSVSKETEDTATEFPPTMTGLIIINGTEYLMEDGNYQWERKKGLGTEVVQTDHASPYQMADHIESISVNPNQKLRLRLRKTQILKFIYGMKKEEEKK